MTKTTNLLIALDNVFSRNNCRLTPVYKSQGSPNAAGDSLEFFIKDMFCPEAEKFSYAEDKETVYDDYLSWKGNSTNFPDFIVKGGPGVEPKKLNGTSTGSIALNSSFPKSMITPDTQNIPPLDKIIEPIWETKDIIYSVGNLDKNTNKLLKLWFAYGNTFVAHSSLYTDLLEQLKQKIGEIDNLNFVETKELGRIRNVDKLGVSNLRLRPMWELSHPETVFSEYLVMETIPTGATKINAVMRKECYDELQGDQLLEKHFDSGKVLVNHVFIPDPNESSELIQVTIIEGYTE